MFGKGLNGLLPCSACWVWWTQQEVLLMCSVESDCPLMGWAWWVVNCSNLLADPDLDVLRRHRLDQSMAFSWSRKFRKEACYGKSLIVS
jgi:hypothetical protein